MNVLLLPDTKAASEVVELLTDWSAAKLLRPFCVWTADAQPGWPVRCIRDGVVSEERLSRALAGAVPTEIEFVAFYPLAAGEEAIPGFDEAVERFLENARERLLDRSRERTVTCAMAAAPETASEQLPPGLFRAAWANLLVAPEDRSAPGEINQLEGDDGRFVPHAAHAAATIAVLWSTPSPNRPDLLSPLREEAAGPLQVPVRVVRCFSRILELGFVVDHIAAAAFESRGGWPRPGRSFERAADPERVLADVADAYLREHHEALTRRPFKPIRDVPKPPLSLFEALSLLLDQIVAYLRGLPSRLLREALRAVHERAAEYIEAVSGTTGKVTVKRWREAAAEGEELESLDVALKKEPLVIEDGAVEKVWTELRQTTLGLVDASSLPEAIRPWVRASGDRQVVVCDPDLLANDPAAVETLVGEDQEEEEKEAPLPFLERIRAHVQVAHEAAQARLVALTEPEKSDSDEESEEPASDAGARRGWRWLGHVMRRVTALVFLALIATVAAWNLLSPAAAFGITLGVVALWVLGVGMVARRAMQRPPIPDDDQAVAELGHLNRILERAVAQGDVVRLRRRLEELDTWIAILAELLHRPWVRESWESLDVTTPIDEESLPAACAVAVIESDREVLERFSMRAREKAFHPGWLSSIYRRVHALVVDELPQAAEGSSLRSAAADTSLDTESLRRALLDAVLRGDGRRRLENPVAADLLSAIDAASIGDLAPTVLPLSPDSRPLGPTATWIVPPEGVEHVAAERSGQIVGIRGWKASGVLVAPDLVLTAAAAVVDRLMFVSVPGRHPVEVVEVIAPEGTDLALLRLGEACGEGVPPAETMPTAGAGVVALEATEDGAELHWGFVTDPDEPAVVYGGAAPGLGAPVFDLSARVLAVQGEGERLLPIAAIGLPRLPEASEPVEPVALLGEAASNHSPPKAAVPVSAPEFLDAILGQEERELVSAYWSERTPARVVELVLPPGLKRVEQDGAVGRLSGGAGFLRPLRVSVHRLETTQSVQMEHLSACEAPQTVA